MVVVRTTPHEGQATEWVAVLAAADIVARVEQDGGEWSVLVAEGDVSSAADALDGYDAEAVSMGGGDAAPEWGGTWAGLVAAALLLAFTPFIGFRASAGRLFIAGEGRAAAIVAGQYWRTVTALTLHADATHLLGNVVAIAIFATAVCRQLGPGLGLLLILVTGVTGNLLDAMLRDPAHTAVGASTAVFGALGILAGFAMLRPYAPSRRAWIPFAAGLALLGLLGTSEHADLVAHFCGFQIGLGLGMGTAVLVLELPGRPTQRWLAAVSAAIVVVSWLLAFRAR